MLVTAGAAEAVWLLAQVLHVRQAAVVHHAFTEPEAALRTAGIPVVHVLRTASDGWCLNVDAVPHDADLVVLGNPNNPTGTLDPPEVIASLCRPGRITVVDEAFMDFVVDGQASLAGRDDLAGLVVVRSITKLWGLAGLRAGYLLAPQGLVRRMEAARQPWPVAADALAAITACLADDAWRQRTAREVAVARCELTAALHRLPGVTVWDGAANFLLLHVPDGPRVRTALAEQGIAVRSSTFPGLDHHHLRIAVRGPDDNAVLVDALRNALSDLPRESL